MSAPYPRSRWMWGVGSKRLITFGKLQHVRVVIEARLRRGQHRYLLSDSVEASFRHLSFRDREVHSKDQQIRAVRPQGCASETVGVGADRHKVFHVCKAPVDSAGVRAAPEA